MHQLKKILFIINPVSGTKNKKEVIGLIENFLSDKNYFAEIIYSTHSGHATILAADAVKNNFELVVAVGGDGTVKEVAQSLTKTNAALGILPCGSGNGLARHLGISMKPAVALNQLKTGKLISIDTMQVNEHFSVNLSGIGFDAHVAHLFSKSSKRGLITYAKLAITELFQFKTQIYHLHFSGKTIRSDAFIIVFANAGQWGNNAKIAPTASLQDGLITIGILKKIPLWQLPVFVLRLFKGELKETGYLSYFDTKEFSLNTEKPVRLHIDGEPVDEITALQVKVNLSSLTVMVPE